MTDAKGTPLVVRTTAANVNDGKPAIELLDSIAAIGGKPGRPRRRPDVFQGDAAYGCAENIAETRRRGIRPMLNRPRTEHGSGLGRYRYVVERTLAWFNHWRRIRLCYEKTGDHFQAFHDLACALICANRLAKLEAGF